ncbi:MAG: zinc-binding dehydrogenase [Betaproteobacteria bacterium]|nr:MAG: zinc-binding dehydrogenase [Betaproteobacteria bacterium]
MKAIVMHERGGAEVLRYEDVAMPVPRAGEVLLRVHAATVNHTDLFHRSGQFFIRKPLPHILGMDVAGEIAELGAQVDGWRVGDKVVATFEALGRERDGAYAEYTCVPASELHRIAQPLDFVTAASIGLAFTTAWTALLTTAVLGHDERVVVHAAASGVGTAAVQIARWKGAQVIAICDAAKTGRMRELGAASVIDRGAEDLPALVLAATGGRGASLVLELVGRSTLQHSIAMLADGGRIVCVGTLSGDVAQINVMDLIMKRGTIKGSFQSIARDDFDTVLRLFADGTFEPVIDSVLPLAQARAAHERIESKQVFGKIVLVPSAD